MNDPIASKGVIERTYRTEISELWRLWTTKDGFESWWGPDQFRADVITMQALLGGEVHYNMVAATPEAIAAMQAMGAPTTQPCHGNFTTFLPNDRLVLTQTIDFLPGIAPYDSTMTVDFTGLPDGLARMIMTLSAMHDDETTAMQIEGFTSQLGKLDRRFSV